MSKSVITTLEHINHALSAREPSPTVRLHPKPAPTRCDLPGSSSHPGTRFPSCFRTSSILDNFGTSLHATERCVFKAEPVCDMERTGKAWGDNPTNCFHSRRAVSWDEQVRAYHCRSCQSTAHPVGRDNVNAEERYAVQVNGSPEIQAFQGTQFNASGPDQSIDVHVQTLHPDDYSLIRIFDEDASEFSFEDVGSILRERSTMSEMGSGEDRPDCLPYGERVHVPAVHRYQSEDEQIAETLRAYLGQHDYVPGMTQKTSEETVSVLKLVNEIFPSENSVEGIENLSIPVSKELEVEMDNID